MNTHPVQVVAPIGRDGHLIASLLEKSGLQSRVTPDFINAFTVEERDRMGALLIAEEALTQDAVAHLGELLNTQPPWSDLPVIVLTPGGGETAESIERQLQRLPLGQFSLLERPVRPSTLLSSVQAAIRARKRQFEIRDTIMQRNAALLNLQQSQERLRIATETAHIGTWELDLKTMELDSSDTCKRNYGRTPDDSFTYAELHASMHPEDRDGVFQAVEQAIARRDPYKAEYRIFWPDSSLHWVLASGRVQYGPDQEPLKIVGVTLDVSERHLAMKTLLLTEKLAAVGQIASTVAHEINNPLESVTNLLYLAKASATNPLVVEYLITAEIELRRIAAITRQTLRFHKQRSSPTQVTAEQLFASTLSIYQGRIQNSAIQVDIQNRAIEPFTCLEGDVQQVLNNLIGNAIDAMQKGGKLKLRSAKIHDRRTDRTGLRLTVADSGTGMSAKTLKEIFQPFFTTKGFGGTGLGLWVSKEIIDRHSGTLRVRSSNRKGRSGSVFLLFLPDPSA